MKKASIVFVLLFVSLISAWSISFIGFDTGLLFVITTEGAGAPNPVILQGLGVTLPLVEETEGFILQAGLIFYGCQYMYVGSRAIPADNELADTIWVLFPQLDIRIGLPIKLSDKLTLAFSGGPAFVFPLPLFAFDNGSQYSDDMFAFFYLNLRMFYAEVEASLRWAIVSGVDLTFKVRGLYALATIWDDLSVNRFNGLQIYGLISIEAHL